MPAGSPSWLGTWYLGAQISCVLASCSGLVQKSSEAGGKIVSGSDPGSESLPYSSKLSVTSTSHAFLELARPVARHGQVRFFGVLESKIESSARERRDFLDPVDVDH